MSSATKTQSMLGLSKPPIAIAFLDEPPAGLKQWDGGDMPAGCAFWERAWAGECFYTVPSDHYNCAVGSHTHNIQLPPERSHQLSDTVSYMVETNYLRSEEVAGIPTL